MSKYSIFYWIKKVGAQNILSADLNISGQKELFDN